MVPRRLITVRPDGGRAPRLRALLGSGGHMVRELDRTLAAGMPARYFEAARAVLRRRELRLVFLKQFPDVANARRACYQAVVEAPVRITGGLRGGLLPGGYVVSVNEHASHPIVASLGLVPRRRTTCEAELPSRFSLWLSFGSRVERGTVVHDQLGPARLS